MLEESGAERLCRCFSASSLRFDAPGTVLGVDDSLNAKSNSGVEYKCFIFNMKSINSEQTAYRRIADGGNIL